MIFLSIANLLQEHKLIDMQVWRNWQTRMVQVHMKAISCRFKSCYLHQTKIIRTLNQSVKGSDLSIISNILTLTAKSINTLFMRFESRQRVYTYTLCLDFMLYFYDLVDFLFPADRQVSCKLYIYICQST